MTDNTFKCSCCNQTYTKNWTDEEAEAEFAEKYPDESLTDGVIVCEDCVHIVDAAAAGASPEKLKALVRIRLKELEDESQTHTVN